MQPTRMVLCLGPHRSGTSAVTAALAALGADSGIASVYANEENRKGFFEHPDLIELNERILTALGGSWDEATFQGGVAVARAGAALDPLRAEAQEFLTRTFGGSELSLLKDPRLCLLLDFWLPVIHAAGFSRIDMVHVLRDPLEAALSQQVRAIRRPDYYAFGAELPEGAALWLSYMGQMWTGFDRGRHLVQSYEALLKEPEADMTRMAAFLDLSPDSGKIARFAAKFLDPGMKAPLPTAAERAAVLQTLPQAVDAYARLSADASREIVSQAEVNWLQSLAISARPRLEGLQSAAFGRISASRRALGQENGRQRDELDAARRTETELRRAQANAELTIADLTVQREALVAEAARIETALTEQREADAREHAAHAAALNDAIADLTGQREALVAEAARIETALTGQREADARAHAAHVAALQDAIADLTGQREALVAEAARIETALTAQREADAREHAAHVAALQDAITDLTGQREAEARAHEAIAAELEARIAKIEAQIIQDAVLYEMERDRLRTAEGDALARLEAIRQSRSWRLTAPLRAGASLIREGTARVASVWIRVNHLARRVYRGLSLRAPGTAEVLRKTVGPLIRATNRALLRSSYVPGPQPAPLGDGTQAGFQFDYQLRQVADPYQPLVSVIVPNYNHAPYLRQRLDSIYGQTWPNVEVILMDDCSDDASRDILQDYADRYPDRTRVIFNETNSGGAFRQWEKGLGLARGDLVWIAESDDWCTPNFLETLAPFFANPAMQLAYAPTVFMNEAGDEQVWSMSEYLSDLGPDRWASSFVVSAPRIVREAFAERNIIPNVSSAVFRRTDRLTALEADVWRGMRTCGDWVFYLNQIRGGLLGYSPDAQSYYRLHPSNTSVTSFSKDSYYVEHETVARCVQRHYSVDPSVFTRQRQALILHWARNRPGFVQADFDACYSFARIMAEAARRKPRLLMASFAFCSGGGETFPITLANLMKSAGYDVTFLNCRQEPDVAGIRALLARDIPVVTNFEDLKGILRDFEIEIIHSHHAWTDNTILDLLPQSSKVKTVITLHGMYETLPDSQLRQTLPRLGRRSGAMVYIADKNLSAWQRIGMAMPSQLTQIDNALAEGTGTPVPRVALGIPPDAFVLALVSRAIPPKGWQEAIEAVTLARKMTRRDIRLVLVGDGPEYDRLRGKVPPFVHLEGFRGNTRDYFAMADVGLLPSRFQGESFPLVIIDCLMAGKPVIASDLGEVRRMLSTETGLAGVLFKLADWQIPIPTLADIICSLSDDQSALDRLNAEVHAAAKRFDPGLMRDRYDQVYLAVSGHLKDKEAAE